MTSTSLGPMPTSGAMITVDERLVHAPLEIIFILALDVEGWPKRLSHYRSVRFTERYDGGGIVEMSANRPFGPVNWPTWWTAAMHIVLPGSAAAPSIRYRHVRGITTGMEVEWTFEPRDDATAVRIVHVWNGPSWPAVGVVAARAVIGPVFVHGIACRTLAGLARIAERV